uniref:PGG domain-containing protein n=1 Tax=Leersia perrieri TaxID=77586 RepID=A0A0D9WPC2_9ORYZ
MVQYSPILNIRKSLSCPSMQFYSTSDRSRISRRATVDPDADERNKWFREMRGWLMVVATVAASVTYQAGLNPPGGFWQDDRENDHRAGNPVLRDRINARYQAFYYFNSTAFVTSLVIMVPFLQQDVALHRRLLPSIPPGDTA